MIYKLWYILDRSFFTTTLAKDLEKNETYLKDEKLAKLIINPF